MSQVTSRINLGAKIFPFLAQSAGRSVIVPQYDNNFNRQTYSPEDQDKDIGIPQVYYMHNCMPTAAGIQSIAFIQALAGVGGEQHFDDVQEILDDHGNFALLGIETTGNWYIYEVGHDTTWRLLTTSAHPANLVTSAYCSGTTYIWQKATGCQTYNFTTHALVSQILTGLDVNNTTGIASSFGYLLGWTTASPVGGTCVCDITNASNYIKYDSGTIPNIGDVLTGTGIPANCHILAFHITLAGILSFVMDQNCTATNTNVTVTIGSEFPGGVFWSSTIDCTDFVPSLITGAGGGQVQGARGPINFVFSHIKGILVYCQDNIVAGPYSANSRFPFAFQAIVGSGGVANVNLVTQEDNTNQHYAYTDSGLQIVTMLGSQAVIPEITDFYNATLFEDFNDSSLTFSVSESPSAMGRRIRSVANRYLCFSYNIDQTVATFTHCIIYDQISKRWGKIKLNHVQILDLNLSDFFPGLDLVHSTIGLLQKDGTIQYVNTDPAASTSNGTLILGKYQFVRARNLILDTIDLETIFHSNKFFLTIFTSLSGKENSFLTTPYTDSTLIDVAGSIKYLSRVEGVNHSLCCQGQFTLNSGVITFHLGAKR